MKIDTDQLLNLRLWGLHSVAGAPVIRLCEGKYGITRREWRLLMVLIQAGSLSSSELALRSSLDRPRASKAVRGLIEKSLVQKTHAKGDRRGVFLALTAKGEALVNELYPQDVAINEALLSPLSPEERATLFRLLDVLTGRAIEVARNLVPEVQADRWRGRSKRAPRG